MHPFNSGTMLNFSVTFNVTTTDVVHSNSTDGFVYDSAYLAKLWVGISAILIGAIGTVTNLWEMIHLYRHRTSSMFYWLAINQSVLDIFTCVSFAVSYGVKSVDVYLTGNLGNWLCALLFSDTILWVGLTGSVANQVLIAVYFYARATERSCGGVDPRWCLFAAIAFTWIDGSALNNPFALSTFVKDGDCYSGGAWTDKAGHVVFGAWALLWDYVLPVTLCAFFYGKVISWSFPSSADSSDADGSCRGAVAASLFGEYSLDARLANVVLFAVLWSPCHACLFAWSWKDLSVQLDTMYNVALCVGYIQIACSPLILSRRHDRMRIWILSLMEKICCRRTISSSRENGNIDNQSDVTTL